MKSFYLMLALGVFGLFGLFEWQGYNMDMSQGTPSPRYYSYHGSSGGGYRSSSSGYFSHK